jgi:hypothetical protein
MRISLSLYVVADGWPFGTTEKKTGPKAGSFIGLCLQHLHFVGLHAFLALHSDEGDLLAFLQAFETGALDRTVVNEQVRTVIGGNEAEALFIVEPLDGTGLALGHWNVS